MQNMFKHQQKLTNPTLDQSMPLDEEEIEDLPAHFNVKPIPEASQDETVAFFKGLKVKDLANQNWNQEEDRRLQKLKEETKRIEKKRKRSVFKPFGIFKESGKPSVALDAPHLHTSA